MKCCVCPRPSPLRQHTDGLAKLGVVEPGGIPGRKGSQPRRPLPPDRHWHSAASARPACLGAHCRERRAGTGFPPHARSTPFHPPAPRSPSEIPAIRVGADRQAQDATAARGRSAPSASARVWRRSMRFSTRFRPGLQRKMQMRHQPRLIGQHSVQSFSSIAAGSREDNRNRAKSGTSRKMDWSQRRRSHPHGWRCPRR